MEKDLIAALLTVAPLCAFADPVVIKNTDIAITAKDQPLTQVIDILERKSGIAIHLAPMIAQDSITLRHSGSDLKRAIDALLGNYSHVDVVDGKGQLKRVLVTGRKGDGEGLAATANTVASTATTMLEGVTLGPVVTTGLPEQYRYHKPGSVYQVALDSEALKAVQKGESISVFLPDGQHQVVHDNHFEHDNGDVTWVGYLKDHGKSYRFITTLGQEANIGRVLTPNGQYLLEQEGGQNYLVDVDAAGLQEVTDTHRSTEALQNPLDRSMYAFLYGNWAQQLLGVLAPIRAAERAKTSITLGVYYRVGFAGITSCTSTGKALTKINSLLATTNQAYIDSAVAMTMSLASTPVCVSTYTNDNNNDVALDALTKSGQGTIVAGFPTASGTPTVLTTRNTAKADLVTLLRPFVHSSQKSCGVAWQNNGLSANWAYSVVSNGTSNGYFCHDYTLAHETGHNMGSAHGNTSSGNSGKYAYSYGYGISGVFGTIMNYASPRVGKFSNPAKTCTGTYKCGIAGSNNNARSLNKAAPTVAAFR